MTPGPAARGLRNRRAVGRLLHLPRTDRGRFDPDQRDVSPGVGVAGRRRFPVRWASSRRCTAPRGRRIRQAPSRDRYAAPLRTAALGIDDAPFSIGHRLGSARRT